MTSIQPVRLEEDLALSRLIPSSTRSKVVSVEFACDARKLRYLVRVPETEVTNFSLAIFMAIREFKSSVTWKRVWVVDHIPSDADIIDVTPTRLVELVTTALQPNVH